MSGNVGRAGLFLPNEPHFTKTISSTADKYIKMGFSKHFLDLHKINLYRDYVLLQMPSGARWRIGITDSPDTVWLDDGWRSFTNFYSILVGQTILFKYVGMLVFNVVIFEHDTGFEIIYPIPNTTPGIIDVRSGKSELRLSSSIKRTEKGQASGSKGSNRGYPQAVKPIAESEMQEIPRLEMQPLTSEGKDIEEERVGGNISIHNEGKLPAEVEQQSKTTTLVNKIPLEQTKVFKSQLPYFTAVMEPRYDHVLNVPPTFAKSHFSKSTMVKLSVSDGRSWNFEFSQDQCVISWIPFVQENSLKLGDSCAFELIGTGSRPELKVTVFRKEHLVEDNKEEGTKTATKIIKMKSAAFQKASAFKSSYDFFVMYMQKTYVLFPYDLSIPKNFTRKHFGSNKKSARLYIEDGEVWNVKWFIRGNNATQGFTWTLFVADNNLVEGDACVFELIKNNEDIDVEFKVTIFRKSNYELEPPPSTVNFKPTLDLEGDLTDINTNTRECTALERANAFKCDHPFFISTINSTYLYKTGLGLYVPLKFGLEHLETTMTNVSLQIRDCSEKWDVKCNYVVKRKVFYLVWRQFMEDNNIRIGDVCIFELVDKVNPSMVVVIFRTGED